MDALRAIDAQSIDSQPGSEVSEAIRIARVVCIFFMIFVHVHPGSAEFTADDGALRLFDVMRFFLVDSFGRASVALLSAVAGYLAVFSLQRQPVNAFLGKKARSLLVPLAAWNLILIAVVVLSDQIHEGYVSQSFDDGLSLSRLPALVLGLGGTPANEPLAFLRDVFLCALFTPLMLAMLRRGTRWFVALALGLIVLAAVSPLGVRPSIPALYALGVFIGARKVVPIPSPRLAIGATVLFVALGVGLTWRDLTSDEGLANGATWMEAGFNLIRAPAALTFWSLALVLRRWSIGARIARLEPFIFTAFCIHLIVSKAGWVLWQPAFGGYWGDLYPVFFFGVPFAVIACAVAVAKLLDAYMPAMFRLLNGGRALPRPRRQALPANPAAIAVQPARG